MVIIARRCPSTSRRQAISRDNDDCTVAQVLYEIPFDIGNYGLHFFYEMMSFKMADEMWKNLTALRSLVIQGRQSGKVLHI